MFTANKLMYNPAYCGTREIVSLNSYYRDQWSAIKGAPKSYGGTIDAPLGSKDKAPLDIALGLSFSNEQVGVERKQSIAGYYAFHVTMKNESILSLGLSAGTQIYSADYTSLNPYQQYDPNLGSNVKSALLPNFGAGFFWYSKDFYLGGAIPNVIQNYYDKKEKIVNNKKAQQVRGYYLNGGYVFHSGESFDILPQAMIRYAADAGRQLPVNCDINLSFIAYRRILFGFTYRTDNSIEGIVQLQATKSINIGYAYDYLLSGLSGYNNGAHEIVIGYDFARRLYTDYDKVHFAKTF